jgi:hypothetical protein
MIQPQFPTPTTSAEFTLNDLVTDLQRENLRLQRLVSELLLKNEQLRSPS